MKRLLGRSSKELISIIAPQDVHQTSIVQYENSPKLTEKVDTILAKIEKMEHGYDDIIHLGKALSV